MKSIIFSALYLLIFILSCSATASAGVRQKISFYSKKENIAQIDNIAAVIRIIAGKSVFEAEKLFLGEVELHFPKNQDLPITTAYAEPKVAGVRFDRVNDKVIWQRAIISTGGGANNEFEAHLPTFNSKDFDRLKLKFVKSGIEDVEDNYQPHENGKVLYHKVYMFYYVYTPGTGSPVDVRFEVAKNIYKLGDDCPKHFSSVLITRQR